MRLASVFFLSALLVAVHSAPVESASEEPLRHDPAAHAPGQTGPMPAHDMPVASMENDAEPEMTHDMTEDKEKPDGKPGKHTEEKPDRETGKPAMPEDGMQHEDGHEGHESGSHGGESHEGHDHGSHGSQGSHASDDGGESHEGHDHGSHGSQGSHASDESHGSHGSNEPQGDTESAMESSDAPTTIITESEDTPEPSSEAEEGVCISASHLEGFGSHELVFEKHVLARVLCDAAGSCATAGHIVNYKGNSMMMGRYCDFVGCEQKVLEVNSPRYQRGLKIPSVSDDMHFTAFAARFETRGEEAVLAAAVRAGL